MTATVTPIGGDTEVTEIEYARIEALRDLGDDGETNAEQVRAADLIWGLYGVAHSMHWAIENESEDVCQGLASAAKAISAELVDRMLHDCAAKYVRVPD